MNLKKEMSAVLMAPVLILAGCGAPSTLLTVNAAATTRTAPDLAIVTIGVVALGANAGAAQQAQATRMGAVIEAARSAGVAEADIQTIGYSLEPQFVYARGAAPRIGGYVSRNVVALRVSNFEAVSVLIDATVAEGANELQGVQFTSADEEASREAARTQALETARRRAETYAEAAGMRVVRLDSITEPGRTIPSARRNGGYGAQPLSVSAEQSANAPIAAGALDNQARVVVVFELR